MGGIPPGHEYHTPVQDEDGTNRQTQSAEGRIKVCLYVWDTGTLDWIRMEQPSLEAADANLYLALDEVEALLRPISKYTVKVDYFGGTNPIYVGFATPGSATDVAAWRIVKITWDGNDNPTDVQWADGNTNFDNIWDNRAGYSYS